MTTSSTGLSKSPAFESTQLTAPPGWALLQRKLFKTMESATIVQIEKYSERGGAQLYADCVDDLYEMFYDWGLFYAIGAGESVLGKALEGWNAVTRYNDDGIVHREKHQEFLHGSKRFYSQQLHREFFNKATMSGAGSSEWHHIGEACVPFYHFGLANPTISENVRRTRAFAAMFMGEDPLAPNFDKTQGIFRSPIQTSEGPYIDGDVSKAMWWLNGMFNGKPQGPMTSSGRRATLYPIVKHLDTDWHKTPKQHDKIVQLFEKIVLRGDTPQSLAATGLITNAYLYTGDEKYRRWVLDYVELWIQKIRDNHGIVPDNIGPTGKVGEHRNGQWWGGMYGWSSRGYSNIFNSLTIGAECALLLSGDYNYLEILRSQILMLSEKAIEKNGMLLVPSKFSSNGWHDYQPIRPEYPAHLYHASMKQSDLDLYRHLTQDAQLNSVLDHNDLARLNYYAGTYPDWPQKILAADLNVALKTLDRIQQDKRNVDSIIADNIHPGTPVITDGITQVSQGGPPNIYNGGLQRSTIRYFDQEQSRPGLPADTAAVVKNITADRVELQIANIGKTNTHTVIVQAGIFGEHQFASVQDRETNSQPIAVKDKCFSVKLKPSTVISLDATIQRFNNKPSYRFPWMQETIPIPFQ